MDDYKRILDQADAHFDSVVRSQPGNLQCGKGCSLCCHGLFEIVSADVALLAEGLATLHPSRRTMIVRRALEIFDQSVHPDLRESSPEEKEGFFRRTENTPCPNLDENGLCMMYEHRPLVCRTFGLPLKDGRTYLGDICDLNFRDSTEFERRLAAWDLQWEDVVGVEDQFTIPEAIVLIARMRGWL